MNSIISYGVLITTCILFSCQGNESKEPDDAQLESPLSIAHQEVKRVGMVIKIKPDKLEEYMALHADSVEGVRDLLCKYNLRNFSIFMTQLEDSNYY